jgi:hypothetical protein
VEDGFIVKRDAIGEGAKSVHVQVDHRYGLRDQFPSPAPAVKLSV